MSNDSSALARGNGHDRASSCELELHLCVRDPEVHRELLRRQSGAERDAYALSALRVGVLAMGQAGGAIDVERIKVEGDRLIGELRSILSEHNSAVTLQLGGLIAHYFDPQSGNLTQRLDRLISKDGELETVLARYLDGQSSSLARTLSEFVGEGSPIFKELSPAQADGVLAKIREAVDGSLATERQHLMRLFSLDDKGSALSRLVAEITGENGRLRDDLSRDIDKVRREFSLDQPEGALSRLFGQVQETTADLKRSLSLDEEASSMARLRRELLDVMCAVKQSNTEFQSEVRSKLAEMSARREESDRSTLHGLDFEEAVGAFLGLQVRGSGDLLEGTGTKAGSKPRCKVGDYVVTLGTESAAEGVRIVFEAKDSKSYDLRAALSETDEARDNRQAQVGVFVFSKPSAPAGVAPLSRFANNIVALWDRDDKSTDPILVAAISLARALAVREHLESTLVQADFGSIEDAVRRIAKTADVLSDIVAMAGTVRLNGEKIRNQAETFRGEIDKQLAILNEHLGALRKHAAQS